MTVGNGLDRTAQRRVEIIVALNGRRRRRIRIRSGPPTLSSTANTDHAA